MIDDIALLDTVDWHWKRFTKQTDLIYFAIRKGVICGVGFCALNHRKIGRDPTTQVI
jgi:hypothetical protein